MNDDKINDEKLIKKIGAWEFSVSKAKQCMFIDTTDYHPKKLELSRQDVQDLLNKMDKIIKGKKWLF
jgi:hypothetical protein